MKLRIRGDSLRFRLTRGEASKLADRVKVSESVHFSSSSKDILTYSVEASDSITQLAALIENGNILVMVPASLVHSWIDTDQVGIEDTQPISADRKLRILIEKDFRCLERRPEEDETDNFPHP